MFCPRCGDEMILNKNELYCRKGNMYLSQRMFDKLTETFILKIHQPKNHHLLRGLDSQWFCPKHGEQMINKNGYTRCPICDLSISEFIYELIQFNPHKEIEY